MSILLKTGDHSSNVAYWQGFLVGYGFSDVLPDAHFGAKTALATRSFQAANGLRADGIVGQNTIKAAKAFGFKGFPEPPALPKTSASWYVSPALEVLRHQLNALYPSRNKASDGGIGDANHASRVTDHNPHVKDRNGKGVVTARDFTHDPIDGNLDCQKLADALVKHKDPRIKYIIWNKRICSSLVSPWKWRPYSGSNAHKHHLHVSVNAEERHWNNTDAWNLEGV